MKQLLFIILTALSLNVIAAETQKVCIDKIGADGKSVIGKDGKPVQDCKVIKVHKKLEGTNVPTTTQKK
jgi:hypothetical protein